MGIGKSTGLAIAACGIAVGAVVAAISAAPAARTQASSTTATPTANTAGRSPAKPYELDLDASKQWIDTKIDLRAEEKVHVAATGGSFHSDGRILVLVLRHAAAGESAR